jgi:hypothetical protein
MDDEHNQTKTRREAENDNARLPDAETRVEETCRATGDSIERLVIDMARLIGRRMAREDYARTAANDNSGHGTNRDEPEAE